MKFKSFEEEAEYYIKLYYGSMTDEQKQTLKNAMVKIREKQTKNKKEICK